MIVGSKRKFVRHSGHAFRGRRGPLKWSPESQTHGHGDDRLFVAGRVFRCHFAAGLDSAGGPIVWLARMAWLRELGRVPYCVYIIHLVVNVFCHLLLRRASPATADARGAAVTLFSPFMTFGIAWISWKLFEGPLVRLAHSFKYQPAGAGMDLGP